MIDLLRMLGMLLIQGSKFAKMGLVLYFAFRGRGVAHAF
jgi:hypothetical protein